MAESTPDFLSHTRIKARKLKEDAEKSIQQVPDEKLFAMIDGESNSVALLMKHIAGNMRSRWRDRLETDGEKPDRNRPSEFDQSWQESREDLHNRWDQGWTYFLDALDHYAISDLSKNVMMRGNQLTLFDAIYREMMHYSAHVGQIIFLSKHLVSETWNTLTIPRDSVWKLES